MFEPFGYINILISLWEITSLIGLLTLFFAERSGYGRDAMGRESWPAVLLYDILTAYAYSLYWRLKVTYALHARDRLSRWEWILLLGALFVFYRSLPSFILLLTVWDFFIRRKLYQKTRMDAHWFWTFLCGHLYLAAVMERSADLLPVDFRVLRPERRQRILQGYGISVVAALVLTGVAYGGLVEWRRTRFARIEADAVDRSGYWYETSEHYETLYAVDKNGHKTVHTLLKVIPNQDSSEWLQYEMDTKFHDGLLYSWSWFSCLDTFQLIEMNENLLVFKKAEDKTVIENRLERETFAEKQSEILSHGSEEPGWKLGQLLSSPWTCELSFIPKGWAQSMTFINDQTSRFSIKVCWDGYCR